jgi:lysophospholipase L1-like esterase
MNKKLILGGLLLMGALTMNAQDADWGQISRYDQANKELIAKGVDSTRVVLIGNSITDAWPFTRPDFFKDNNLVGRGISGQTSPQFLVRFRNDVINLQPAVMVLNVATNDIAENTGTYNEDFTFGNICSMVQLAKRAGIRVILTSVLPAGQFPWRPSVTDGPEKIFSLNARISKLAEDERVPFVDYYSSMLAKDGRSMISDYTQDGVHPNAKGYEVMENLLLPVIKQELAKKSKRPAAQRRGGSRR